MKKADNFDAKKWLVENKVTTQSRLNEEEYSSERINQRDVEIAGGEVINHTFDTIDIIDLDNGYKVKVLSTYYFRDPGVKGYSDTTSEKNPMISGVKTTLMDPSGKPIKNHNFTGSGQWWMLTSGKKYFMPQIKAWWEEKMGKLGLEESRLNEETKKPSIKVLKDIYYFDKLSGLSTKDDVDEKYHDKAKLVFKKGKTVKDDTEYDDSEYEMIISSKRITKGTDYSI